MTVARRAVIRSARPTPSRLLGIALAAWSALAAGCEDRRAAASELAPRPGHDDAGAAVIEPPGSAAPGGATPAPAPTRGSLAPSPPDTHVCRAPSLLASGRLDGRASPDLVACVDPASVDRKRSSRCADPSRPLALDRLDAAVLPLDAATRARIAGVARRGRGLGRNPRAFGLVGDSMTASWDFLQDFGARRRKEIAIAPGLAPRLALPGDRSIIDFFRGQEVERLPEGPADAFTAQRAARVGARASWAVEYDDVDASPIGKMVRAVNPAYAVVLFGGNDAAYRVAPPEEVADAFERDMREVIAALERRGVVPVLSTVARHLDQPGVPNCADPGAPSDHRVAVATTAISDRAAQLACREHLPLVDLRHAMDDLLHHGLGPDGVHPHVHPDGGAVLTAEGLACGYNVRNAVTLMALTRVVAALTEDGAIDPG